MKTAQRSAPDACITGGWLAEDEIARFARRMDAARVAYVEIITRAGAMSGYQQREAEAYRVWRQSVDDYEALLKNAKTRHPHRPAA